MNKFLIAILAFAGVLVAGRAVAAGQAAPAAPVRPPQGPPVPAGQSITDQLVNTALAPVVAAGQQFLTGVTTPIAGAITEAQATVQSTLASFTGNIGAFVPYALFAAPILAGALTFRKNWDPVHGCCDLNMVGVSVNCKNIGVINCYYGFDPATRPRQEIVNLIFNEMKSVRGIVAKPSSIEILGGFPILNYFPNLPTLRYPEQFRNFLTPAEILRYRELKTAIVSENKALLIPYAIGRPMILHPTVIPPLVETTAIPKEFDNWIY